MSGRLVEFDPTLAASATAYAAEHGLDVEVGCGDASSTDSYAGAVPAGRTMFTFTR